MKKIILLLSVTIFAPLLHSMENTGDQNTKLMLFLKNIRDENKETIFHFFILPSSVDLRNADGQTALMIALHNNNIDDETKIFIAHKLLYWSKYPLMSDNQGKTALDYTTNESIKSQIKERALEAAQEILDNGSIKLLLDMDYCDPSSLFLDIFTKEKYYIYLSHNSARKKMLVNTSKLLLEWGATITPYQIEYALRDANLELFTLLLHYGAKPTKEQLHKALNQEEYSLTSTAECIDKGDCSTIPLDTDNNTTLMTMINQGDFDTVNIDNRGFNCIVTRGLNHKQHDNDPFFLATKDSINMQNKKGETALIIAAKRTPDKHKDPQYKIPKNIFHDPVDGDLIFMLLKNGANPNIKDNTGQRAIDYLHEAKKLFFKKTSDMPSDMQRMLKENNEAYTLTFKRLFKTIKSAASNFCAITTTTRQVWLTTKDDETIGINYEQAEESAPLALLLNNCSAAGTKKRPIKVNFSIAEVFEFMKALNTPITTSNTPDCALRFNAPNLYARCMYEQLPNEVTHAITRYYMPSLDIIKQKLIMTAKSDILCLFFKGNNTAIDSSPYVSNTTKMRINALDNLTINKVLLLESMVHNKIEHNKYLHVYPNTSHYHALQSLDPNEYTLLTKKLPLMIQDKHIILK